MSYKFFPLTLAEKDFFEGIDKGLKKVYIVDNFATDLNHKVFNEKSLITPEVALRGNLSLYSFKDDSINLDGKK